MEGAVAARRLREGDVYALCGRKNHLSLTRPAFVLNEKCPTFCKQLISNVEEIPWSENKRTTAPPCLAGVIQEPIYSHSAGGEDYFTFPLRCLRLSGAEDLLNLVLSRTQLEQLDGRPGDRVGVVGQVRSYNNHSGQGSKLVITVRVQALFPAPAQEDSNQVRLVGNLCRKPVYRRTPLGREIADLLLAVNRGCGKADYLPCIAWGGQARRAGWWNVGDRVCVRGRLQSRRYRKSSGQMWWKSGL